MTIHSLPAAPTIFTNDSFAAPPGYVLPYVRTDLRTLRVTALHSIRVRETLLDISVEGRHRGYHPYRRHQASGCSGPLKDTQLRTTSPQSANIPRAQTLSPPPGQNYEQSPELQSPRSPAIRLTSPASTLTSDSESELGAEEDLQSGLIANPYLVRAEINGIVKYLKPDGEAGRPGRGGYNLKRILAWPHGQYGQIKKTISKLIAENLNEGLAISSQVPDSVETVCLKAAQAYPVLNNYDDHWATRNFIQGHLKYTSAAIRRMSDKQIADITRMEIKVPKVRKIDAAPKITTKGTRVSKRHHRQAVPN